MLPARQQRFYGHMGAQSGNRTAHICWCMLERPYMYVRRVPKLNNQRTPFAEVGLTESATSVFVLHDSPSGPGGVVYQKFVRMNP